MMNWSEWLSGSGFVPRTQCGAWTTPLIAQHVWSDAATFLAYQIIPILMLRTAALRRDRWQLSRPARAVLILYASFIVLCGWTHFFDALMFYHPLYRLNGVVRLATAVASVVTAVTLGSLLPKAFDLGIGLWDQKRALAQQSQWLTQILDAATDGKLHLCAAPGALDAQLAHPPGEAITVAHQRDLRTVRQAVKAWGRDQGLSGDRAYNLMTAVHEAAMNALLHGGGGIVRLQSTDEYVQALVKDRGPGIALDLLPISTLKQGYSSAGTAGQGWYLVLQLTDAVYLQTDQGGTHVLLEMERAPVAGLVPQVA